ncbi:hypothetical protein BT96DRAFT_824669, partial [Gymnopus androsaceus JB14]
ILVSSPSPTSAANGFHYSGKNNAFWECLINANFLTPDITYKDSPQLPERFSIGLTDLVPRPTPSGKDILEPERRQAVPSFLKKIAKYRPRIVCFVSLGIGGTVAGAVSCPWNPPEAPRGKGKPTGELPGIQEYMLPFKLRYPEVDAGGIAETLFFAIPSTSAQNCFHYTVSLTL